MTDRALQLHCARVYLAQARVWRHRAATMPFYWRSFWQYLDYAANCRRKAAAMREPVNGDLFESLRNVA